jgi:hypothetical protein
LLISQSNASSHTAHLEHKPLLQVEILWGIIESEFVVSIVSIDEILDDGAGLLECDISVGILDDGQSAVAIHGEDGRAFGVVQRDIVDCVGKREFVEDYRDFPAEQDRRW